MSTPKSAAGAKNASAAAPRPMLYVTKSPEQETPQTMVVPNGRRLPLNGRIATMSTTTKQRQKPATPSASANHQTISETTSKKAPIQRPRQALFYSSARMFEEGRKGCIAVFSAGIDPTSEQHQPLLSNGHGTLSPRDSLDSHPSAESGFGTNDNWSAPSRSVRSLT